MHGSVDFEELVGAAAANCLAEFDPDTRSSREKLEQILTDPSQPASRHFGRLRAAQVGTGLCEIVFARLRSRQRLVVPVVAALVVAAGAAAAVSLSGGRSAPVPLPGGGGVLCPADYPFLADRSLGLEYPPNYPGPLPRGTRGISCYASERDAIEAGFAPAPTPAGDVRLGALYLAPPSATVRGACRAARQLMRATVYCPSVLPTRWANPVSNTGQIAASGRGSVDADCPSSGCAVPLLSIWGDFTAPSQSVWSETGFSAQAGFAELSVWEMSRAQQHAYPYLTGCEYVSRPDGVPGPPRLLARTRFHGFPAAWYACTTFAGASTALEWQIGDEIYGISASGPPIQRRQLVQYIANHLRQEASNY
jgi:hypothetical protein